MAATWSVFRFVNCRFSTMFSAAKTRYATSKTVHSWSIQFTRQPKQLHAHNRHLQIKCHSLSCDHILGKNMFQKPSLTTRTFVSTIARRSLLLSVPPRNLFPQRGITMVSRKGKRKTCKAVAKRFIRTGKGKLKRWRCGNHHNQTKKTGRRKRFLRKPTYASKTQLKTLNKMLNGW